MQIRGVVLFPGGLNTVESSVGVISLRLHSRVFVQFVWQALKCFVYVNGKNVG